MVNNNNAETIRRLDKLGAALKEFSRTGNQGLIRLIMRHYGSAIIPLISLEDGGRARGRFVGMLRQLKVSLPTELVRDRTLLGGEVSKIDAKELNAGIREGFSVKRTRISAELEMSMTRTSHQKMYPRVRDVSALHQSVMKLLQTSLQGGSSGGNK